jgi:hypothetical protein
VTARRYECHKCNANVVKLWRDYGTPFHWDLWCVDCACTADPDKQIDPATIRDDGTRVSRTYLIDSTTGSAFVEFDGEVHPKHVWGTVEVRHETTDTLGWYVPAVPSEGPKETPAAYWGYTSYDPRDYEWWAQQPLRALVTA